ncbi:protein phosphatase CheZ [Curvivirga sp.]|uniref:protein phosphatase CheZ n=1 Tax=Curvivirga sp. TaxID=2856848 RepID=UPI003B5BE49D
MVATVNINENDDKLKAEIVSLVQYIRRFREEIAHMVQRENDQTRFESMSDQLDEIVGATESATNSILESVENIESVIDGLRDASDDAKRNELCDKISENTMHAMEACTFQDITGQRVTKIVRSMKFVEQRVDALTELWGRDEIEDMAVGFAKDDEPTGDAALLNGPALPEETSISQDDIDKLFD